MNISKKISGLLFLTLILQTGLAQNNQEGKTEESKWGIKFSGFLRFDVWHDTRMVNATREDLFLFYPKNERLNSEGIDLNHIDNTHASISASRLSSAITTPDVLNAKSSGVIEVDFYDANNAGLNVLRIRHAYFKFVWDKAEFIAGKTWHPLFVNEVYPDVVALDTGAPFQPFLRNPLILASYNILPSLKIIGAAITQRNKAKVSHDPSASAPFHYSKIPNLHAQLQYKNRSIVAGLAADFKRVRPSILTEDKTRFNDKYLNSTAYMAYFKYTIGDFVFRAKAIKGQNMSELAMLGGYAVESKDTITNVETYTPYNHLYFWINPVYGKKYCIGLFAGYAL
ncbi:MAG TPA: hypothetical protein PKW37_07810, partial [Salinivirgaceae bacterium]|nr:hypothetical protein [Salinivirgaceae bacterium]